jgi:hypothetical protein
LLLNDEQLLPLVRLGGAMASRLAGSGSWRRPPRSWAVPSVVLPENSGAGALDECGALWLPWVA